MRLTSEQQTVLEHIKAQVAEWGDPPHPCDIASATALSIPVVCESIKALRAKGELRHFETRCNALWWEPREEPVAEPPAPKKAAQPKLAAPVVAAPPAPAVKLVPKWPVVPTAPAKKGKRK